MSDRMEEPTCPRDRHLFSPGKKRILALDGGGVRGAMTIAFLEELEKTLAEIEGKPVRLCDWFDMIGGTSTGAIIATALCLGLSASEIKTFYQQLAPRVFKRSPWRIPGWSAKFNASGLKQELVSIFADRRLDSTELQTGLCMVLKRIDTGGSWVILNNPRSKYWHTPEDRSFIGNSHLILANLVRASTAAPHYFDPELIEIIEGQPPGLFVDGGLTPHNNPSLILFMAAVLQPFGLNWQCGPEHLNILSVGTGSFRPTLSIDEARRSRAIGLAVKALAAQIAENQRLTLMLMSWFGQTNVPWAIDSEVGDLGTIVPPRGPLFGFDRLDVCLEHKWLSEHLNIEISNSDLHALREMDNPAWIPKLYDLGRQAAALQVKAKHFASW